MNLTKEDVDVIRKAIREENEPMRDAVKQVLTEQMAIVSKVNDLEKNVYLIMHTLKLSPRNRDLQNALSTLD